MRNATPHRLQAAAALAWRLCTFSPTECVPEACDEPGQDAALSKQSFENICQSV